MLYKRPDQQAENQYGNCLIVQGLLLKEDKKTLHHERMLVTTSCEAREWALGF